MRRMPQEMRPEVQVVQPGPAMVPKPVLEALSPSHFLMWAYQLRMLCHLNAYHREDQVVVPLGMQDGLLRQHLWILADQDSQA